MNQNKNQEKMQRDKARHYYEEALRKQRDGDIDESIRLYRQSLELYPTAEAHTLLGWAFSGLGKWNEAIDECKKAITLDPDYGNPYNDIGAYLIQLNQLEEAIIWLRKALKSKRYDNYAFPYLNLGRIYEKKGRWLRALHFYELARLQDPKLSSAKTAYDKLHGMFN